MFLSAIFVFYYYVKVVLVWDQQPVLLLPLQALLQM